MQAKTVWEIHAERDRRRAQFQRIEEWIQTHKRLADLISVCAAVAILALAILIEKLLDLLGRITVH